jgi:hypothetical protein
MLQAKLEAEGAEALQEAQAALLSAGHASMGADGALDKATAPLLAHASRVRSASWELFEGLIFRYRDGYVQNVPGSADPVPIGYPAAWLVRRMPI